jgi:hypothetical protein
VPRALRLRNGLDLQREVAARGFGRGHPPRGVQLDRRAAQMRQRQLQRRARLAERFARHSFGRTGSEIGLRGLHGELLELGQPEALVRPAPGAR